MADHLDRALGDLRGFEGRGMGLPSPLPPGYEHVSWGNDAAPSVWWPASRLKLWADHPDPDQREAGGSRYTVVRTDEEGNTDLDLDPVSEGETWPPVYRDLVSALRRRGNPAAPAWYADPTRRYEVAQRVANRLRLPGQWLDRANQLIEQYRRAGSRSGAPQHGMLKKEWQAVRAAVLDVMEGMRTKGIIPAARPRPRPARVERDPRPAWASDEDSPGWMIESMEYGESEDVQAFMAGMGSPLRTLERGGEYYPYEPRKGWFAEVTGATGTTFGFSKLDDETEWAADSCFGPKMEPMWSNGRGTRVQGLRLAKDPLRSWLNQAVLLAQQGVAGPYDPRSLAMSDVPGQMRMFNPRG